MSGGKRKAGSSSSRPAKKATSKRPSSKPGKRPSKKASARSKKKAARSPLKRRLIFAAKRTALVGLVLTLVAVGGFIWLYRSTDIPNPNEDFETQTSFVYYDDGKGDPGKEIGTYAVQNRDSIPYDEMPQTIKDAVVAAENRSFWTDSGIDPKGILRAVFNNASSDNRQGASTITQQYVKIFYLTTERTSLRATIASLSLRV